MGESDFNCLEFKDNSIVLESLKALKSLRLSAAKFAMVAQSVGSLAGDGKNESDLRLLAFSLIPTGFKISDDDFDSLFIKTLLRISLFLQE